MGVEECGGTAESDTHGTLEGSPLFGRKSTVPGWTCRLCWLEADQRPLVAAPRLNIPANFSCCCYPCALVALVANNFF